MCKAVVRGACFSTLLCTAAAAGESAFAQHGTGAGLARGVRLLPIFVGVQKATLTLDTSARARFFELQIENSQPFLGQMMPGTY